MTELAKAAFEEVKAFTQRNVEAPFEALPAARGDQAMIRLEQRWSRGCLDPAPTAPDVRDEDSD